MEKTEKTTITVEATVKAPIEKVWKYWTDPVHIMKWNNASDDWYSPYAENDLSINGKFKITMAARDGSASFDFEGVYTRLREFTFIEYIMSDGRKAKITFSDQGDTVKVIETFNPEDTHPIEMQRGGWQAILDNFKKYTESN